MPRRSLVLAGVALALGLGCVERSPSEPDAIDDAPDVTPPADAIPPDARSDGMPSDGMAPDPLCGPDGLFARAVAAARADPESYVCEGFGDCVEVEICPGEFCFVGPALNAAAAAALDAEIDPDTRCEACGPAADPFCPEPEPPMPDCVEGTCLTGGGRQPTPRPADCEAARASHAIAVEEIQRSVRRRCADDADCALVRFANGCTDGACRSIATSVAVAPVARAMLDAHLRYTDCTLCGDPILMCPPAAARCEGEICLGPDDP